MTGRIRSALSVLSAGASAAVAAAALALGAAAVGWLVGSRTLAGALAMIVSGLLIIGFGGIQLPWWAIGIVGLSWAFADDVLARLGMPGPTGLLTMAAVYLILGTVKGQARKEVLEAGAGPVLVLIVGVALAAALFSRHVAEGVVEAVLSASMVSGARSARGFAAFKKEHRLRVAAMASPQQDNDQP